MKQTAHIALSVFLAGLLLFGNTSKEFIHLFATHEDTAHNTCSKGELSFEKEHHHCSFLSFAVSPFLNAIPVIISEPVITDFPSFDLSLSDHVIPRFVHTLTLRGPPPSV